MEPYRINYDWVWAVRRPGDPVTLRAHFSFPDAPTATRAVAEFFGALMAENGFYGSGGWAAHEVADLASATTRVIDFIAGGEDVADAIEYAAEDAVAHFGRYHATTVRWEERPYPSR